MKLICEPVCDDKQHVSFNSEIINTLSRLEGDRILLLCSKTHWHRLMDELSPASIQKIDFHEIKLINRQDSIAGFFDAFRLVRLVYSLAKRNKISSIIFLTATAGILEFVNREVNSQKVYAIMHMALSRLNLFRPHNPFNRWFTLYSVIERLKPLHLNIVVLEAHIKFNLLAKFPHLNQIVKCVEHPIPEKRSKDNVKLVDTSATKKLSKKVLGFPGNFTFDKGAADFINLSRMSIVNNGHVFKVIGCNKEVSADLCSNLQPKPIPKSFITLEDYSRQISQCDYLFLGHKSEIYNWTASGVYVDAMELNIPIIAKRNQLYEREFEKYGAMGFLYENIDDICDFLKRVRDSDYLKFKENMRDARETRNKSFSGAMNDMFGN